MGSIGLVHLIIIGVILVVVVGPWWKILAKSGNTPAISLLMLVPLVNVALLLWFAFSEWPIEKEIKALRQQRSV